MYRFLSLKVRVFVAFSWGGDYPTFPGGQGVTLMGLIPFLFPKGGKKRKKRLGVKKKLWEKEWWPLGFFLLVILPDPDKTVGNRLSEIVVRERVYALVVHKEKCPV